jgi:hypothetical protein
MMTQLGTSVDVRLREWFKFQTRTVTGSDDENHNLLLSKILQRKSQYWQGWNSNDIKVQDIPKIYDEAIDASRQQHKVLNKLRFITERAIALHMRLYDDDEHTEGQSTQPIAVIILTGSQLMNRDMKSIQTKLKAVKGGADQFSIQTH